jgi:hypothetical protein
MATPRIFAAVVGCVVGGWMLFDGLHVILKGKYFGPDKPGPWSALFARAGIDPFKLGPVFIAFGVLWLGFLVATLCDQKWGRYGAAVVAVATLWYLPVGTVLSLIYLLLLYYTR